MVWWLMWPLNISSKNLIWNSSSWIWANWDELYTKILRIPIHFWSTLKGQDPTTLTIFMTTFIIMLFWNIWTWMDLIKVQLNVDLFKVSFSIITLYNLHTLHMHLNFFHAFDVYMFHMVKVVGVKPTYTSISWMWNYSKGVTIMYWFDMCVLFE